MDAARSLNPTCEDYHSGDESEAGVVLESPRKSPIANVAARRSHPSDLGADRPAAAEKVANIDLQSDSGYSSHTAATMSSADSAPSAKSSQSPPAAPASAASGPAAGAAPLRRRPEMVAEDRKSSSQSSPRKQPQRTGSVSSKRPSGNRRPTGPDCTDPNCTKCAPNTLPLQRRRPGPSPLDSAPDVSYAPYDQRSQHSDPAPSQRSPPSPTYSRQPGPYLHGPAVVQPAQTSRRRSSSTAPRPMSYHGEPGSHYLIPGMTGPVYPSHAQEHGPPPSMSAHYNLPQYPHPSPFLMGPANYFSPGHQMQTAQSAYDLPPSARGSYQTGRPSSVYGQPLVIQNQNPARYGDVPQSAREGRFPQWDPQSESDSFSDEEYYEEGLPASRDPRNERAPMPPPKLPSSKSAKNRRPSLRHANTTQVYNERRMSQSQNLPERPRERDPRSSKVNSSAPSRAASVSRPSLASHKAQSHQETSRPIVTVENSRQRRQSYQAYDTPREHRYAVEQKRRNRDSKMYYDDPDAILVSESGRRRRQTDAGNSRRNEYYAEDKGRRAAMDAEAYQAQSRGSNAPIVDQVHREAKRQSRVPSGQPSDAASSHSGSDRKSRVTTVTNGGNGEIRLRVDASAPLRLDFNGEMEGRTLQINPTDDGMADIVISSSRGEESTYRSQRGSQLGASSRKSLMAPDHRREAEVSSIRSGRSSQGRREGVREKRLLANKRHTEYD